MKLLPALPFILLGGSLLAAPDPSASTAGQDPIAVARSALQADRRVVVAEVLQLTEAESGKFWPLYHQYRAELSQVGDGLLKLTREYAAVYPDVPEDRARQLLKELSALEKKESSLRAAYLKKFGKILPAAKTLRFAQVENRLDLAVRLRIAAGIPLVPIEGELTPRTDKAVSYVAGVPGGTIVQTSELKATVTALDPAGRTVTLLSQDGIKETMKAGPEVINFDQIRVGDELKVKAVRQVVVQMAEPGGLADDGSAGLVALAPEGAKPGGLVAGTTKITATLTALDEQNRTATLRYEDGTSRTFFVRNDVEMRKYKVGDQVMIRITEMIALSMEKP
jgi:hypothetical protein